MGGWGGIQDFDIPLLTLCIRVMLLHAGLADASALDFCSRTRSHSSVDQYVCFDPKSGFHVLWPGCQNSTRTAREPCLGRVCAGRCILQPLKTTAEVFPWGSLIVVTSRETEQIFIKVVFAFGKCIFLRNAGVFVISTGKTKKCTLRVLSGWVCPGLLTLKP